MKKTVISISAIVIAMVLTALVFDWGRREVIAPETDTVTTTDLPIFVNNVKENQEISSPLKIEGKARGFWFFEASFPIQLVDTDGNILATAIATADGEWMTTEFVNFTANLEYVKPTSTNHALLILNKDNPSGDPDKDQSIFIPVILK